MINDIINNISSIELPTGSMGVGGIIVLIIALKFARRTVRVVLIIAAVLLFVGAVLWHIRKNL